MSPEDGLRNASGGRKILFYTDARHFGGHEVASLHALDCLLESGNQVHVVFRKNNQLLSARLNRLKKTHPDLELTGLEVPPLKYPDLSWVLYRHYLGRLRRLFEQVAPSLVFVSQGNLAISWAGTRTAHELQIPCLSYIPMAQPLRVLLGAKGWLRDCFSRRVLQWPDHWLTCTEAQRERLRTAGASQPIGLLPNPIIVPHFRSRAEARAGNGIPAGVRAIGMAGRFNNRQKGCDLFVEALQKSPPESPLRAAWLLFIGDGEERETMRAKLGQAGWAGRMSFTGWTETPWEHYAALDLLVMPSHFEGQPLAMQEAILCGVPICGSDIDGLAEYLPANWLFPSGNISQLRRKMEAMLLEIDRCGPDLASARERIQAENRWENVMGRLNAALEATRRNGASS